MSDCRLCGGATQFQFTKQLMQRYDVSFFRCSDCESLQSEQPYWLDEAYGGDRSIPDIGAAARLRWLFPLAYSVAKLAPGGQDSQVLDFGGGDGMLVRMLRDAGIPAYLMDKYASNRYAVGFAADSMRGFSLIFAFEVLEHLVNPAQDLDELFADQPPNIMVSTGLYQGQGPDWSYLTPLSGRHVFFYSSKARKLVAERYGYHLATRGPFSLFTKGHLSTAKRGLLSCMFSGKGLSVLRRMGALIPQQPLLEKDRELASQVVLNGGAGRINWP